MIQLLFVLLSVFAQIPSGTVEGVLKDAETQSPISNAEVSLIRVRTPSERAASSPSNREKIATTVTDDAGRFQLRGIPAGNLPIRGPCAGPSE